MKSPIFIFGFPRSGTTLIRSLLGQHSKITLVNEPELVFALRKAGYDIDSKFSPNNRHKLLDELKQIGLCRRHLERNSDSVLPEFLSCKDTLSFVEVYEKLLPRPHGDQIAWGEKSLNNLFFVRDLGKMYPDSAIIHIIRDARSSLLSYFQKKQRVKSGKLTKTARKLQSNWSKSILFFAKQAILWEHWMSIARSSKQLISPEMWSEIRFEDLLEKPENCLRSVCDKIGVAFEDQMLDPASRRSDPVLETEAAYAHQKLAQDLDKSRAHSYEALSPHLMWIVEKHAGEMMQQHGYHLIRPNLPFWQRYTLITVLTRYRWKLKREVDSHINLRCISNSKPL